MLEIRVPVAEETEVAGRIAGEYLPGSPDIDELMSPPRIVLAAVLDDQVIGVCFSYAKLGESVGLEGIAIDAPHAGRGVGSQLLAEFERIVAERGARSVSVGSAEGYVEHFYAKNGYTPVGYYASASHPFTALPDTDLEFLRPREADGEFRINVRSARGYSEEEKQRIKSLLQADEVIFIFEKRIAGEQAG